MPRAKDKVITRERKSHVGRPTLWNDPAKVTTIMERVTREALYAACYDQGTYPSPYLSELVLTSLIGGGYLTQGGKLTKKAERLLEEKLNGVHPGKG